MAHKTFGPHVKLSRRAFLRSTAIAGLAVSISPNRLSAAGSEPRSGGHFRIALGAGATTDTLDPSNWENSFVQALGSNIHSQLTEIDPNGDIVGSVAESWEPTPDARKWVFKLRKGIEFHNGKTLTADDVIASLNLHRGPDTKSVAKSILASVSDIKADGTDAITVELTEGNADFPFALSQYSFSIVPAADGKALWQDGIGCGTYVLEKFEPGVRATVKRNPNNWKTGRGHFDSAEMLSVIDVTARMNALKTGEVDAVDRCDPKVIDLLKADTSVRVEEVNGTQHYTFPMRTDTAPFSDNNVRLALKHAFDREAMLKIVLRGHGFVGADHPISPANRYFASDITPFPYDPEKAKFYLGKAGLASLAVDLSAADAAFAGAVDAAVLYQEHAKKAGVQINVIREPDDSYWSDVWMKKPWTASYWGGRPTEDWTFTLSYAVDSSWNDTFWKHDRFNKLLVEARAMLDVEKRREIYREMQQILRDEGGAVIPLFANYVFAMKTNVQHEQLASNLDLDGLKMIERWWFAS